MGSIMTAWRHMQLRVVSLLSHEPGNVSVALWEGARICRLAALGPFLPLGLKCRFGMEDSASLANEAFVLFA